MMTRLVASVVAGLLTSVFAAAQDAPVPYEFSWSRNEVRLSNLDGHIGRVNAVAPSPDGKKLASASSDATVRIWDVGTGRTERVLKAGDAVLHAAFSRDGRALLTFDSSNAVILWDAASGQQLWISSFSTVYGGPSVRILAFSPDGAQAIVVGEREVRSLDVRTGSVKSSSPLSQMGRFIWVWRMALSPDTRYVAIGEEAGKVFVYETATGAMVRTFDTRGWGNSPHDSLQGLAFVAGGRKLAVATLNGAVALWDPLTGKKLDRVAKGFDPNVLNDIYASPSGKYLVVNDWTTGMLDLETGEKMAVDKIYALDVAFFPDERRVAVAHYDTFTGDATVWDIKEKRDVATFKGAKVTSIAVSTDATGAYLLTGGGIDGGVIDMFNKGFVNCRQGPARGFDAIAACLKAIRDAQRTSGPAAPVLTQDPYESRVAFDGRVAKAKAEFDAAVKAHQDKEDSFRLPDAMLPISFLMVFGPPKVTKTSYDPDTRLFSVDVTPSHSLAGDFMFHLVLRDPVPNEEAREFEKKLAAAEPRVRFLVDDRRFALSTVELLIGDKAYAALPSDASLARALATVDVGAGGPAAATAAATESEFSFSENPELAAKAKALAKARREKADAEELGRLEDELARARGMNAKSYSSDVDAASASAPEDPDAFAIVVGVEKYQLDDLPKADFAERDARAVSKHLAALGVPPRNLKMLLGSEATHAKLSGIVEDWLPKHAGPGAKIYFYFSGHGAPDAATGDSYLVPWDGDPSLLKATGFPLRTLYADLDRVPAARRVAVLDACFSGAGGRSLIAKGTRPLMLVHEVGTGTVTVLAAASASQVTGTLEGQGHGIFTYYLLKAIDGGARSASAVYADLKPKVEDEAGRQNREQVPVFSGPDAPIP